MLPVLSGLACAASAPAQRPSNMPVVLAIPSANMLRHAQYELSGRFQYFTSSDFLAGDPASDTTETQNLNYSSELLFGIENRAEIGIQYGKDFSLSVKALLLREDLFWPDVVFGVRNLFGAQEGTLYGVAENKTLKSLRGESFITAAKTFPSKSRVHLGISVLNTFNEGTANVHGGVEQDLGAGAFLGYEVFERFSDFHQVLTFQWRYQNMVALTLGMTEFQSWIRQDGRWGFFLTPERTLTNGYNSPGLTASLQVMGWAPKRWRKTLPERVAELEARNIRLEGRLLEMQGEMDRLAAESRAAEEARGRAVAAAVAAAPAGPTTEGYQRVRMMLRSIAEKTASDLADPQEVRGLMSRVAGFGPEGAASLRLVAADTAASNASLRIPAMLVMAFSRDSAHLPVLRALTADKDAGIRREALTALVKIGQRSALDDARRLTSDPDETVALAAGEAYRLLSGETADAAPARTGSKAAPGTSARPASGGKPETAKARRRPAR